MKTPKTISAVLLLALCLSSCSTFSKSRRSQRAYEKYVRKSSATRVRQQTRFRNSQPRMPSTPMQPSAPIESTETGPQAVPTGTEN